MLDNILFLLKTFGPHTAGLALVCFFLGLAYAWWTWFRYVWAIRKAIREQGKLKSEIDLLRARLVRLESTADAFESSQGVRERKHLRRSSPSSVRRVGDPTAKSADSASDSVPKPLPLGGKHPSDMPGRTPLFSGMSAKETDAPDDEAAEPQPAAGPHEFPAQSDYQVLDSDAGIINPIAAAIAAAASSSSTGKEEEHEQAHPEINGSPEEATSEAQTPEPEPTASEPDIQGTDQTELGLIFPQKPDEVDDLQEIRGIGPVLEESLHELGVYRFRQIASWTPENVNRLDEQLSGFRTRLENNNWIDQAKKLHLQKYGEPLD